MADYNSYIQKTKPQLDAMISFFEKEVGKIRTGRASGSLVEDVKVDYQDQLLPLKHLTSITVTDPRQIVVQPWDKESVEPIMHAILKENLGITPVVDGMTIRITLPPLTQEYRKELISFLHKKKEESRISIRKWRDEVWGTIQEKTREGELREDDKFRAKDALGKLLDQYHEKLDSIVARKERELQE
jgi:ribosome recycling factor